LTAVVDPAVPNTAVSQPQVPHGTRATLRTIGPGLVVAATGVGAGDLVAAAKAGSVYGSAVLWAALIGALLKLVLAEGVARWQLGTGTTLLEGWLRHFGPGVKTYLVVYYLMWSFVVSGALMAACGLAAHALVPVLSVTAWGAIHGVVALVIVWFEGYASVERVMRWAVAVMFLTLVGAAVLWAPAPQQVLAGLIPVIPPRGALLIAGVIGGVGGTLTLLSYGYWMRERGWVGSEWTRTVRVDLTVAYVLTGIFGLAVISLAAVVLHPAGIVVEGSNGVLLMASMLGKTAGTFGEKIFLIGFWAAVASSIVGVWQGVPYLAVDGATRLMRGDDTISVSTTNRWYRGYLLLMTFPPMSLLLLDRPVWLVVAYAAVGALFMPFLAATLLVLNRRPELGRYRSGPLVSLVLLGCLLLFAVLGIVEIVERIGAIT